jgi:hypothetical protein
MWHQLKYNHRGKNVQSMDNTVTEIFRLLAESSLFAPDTFQSFWLWSNSERERTIVARRS